jgi:hypothetical protein
MSLLYTYSRVYRAIEISNRQAGKLPPAFGTRGMLDLEGHTGPARLGPFASHNFFGWCHAPCTFPTFSELFRFRFDGTQ